MVATEYSIRPRRDRLFAALGVYVCLCACVCECVCACYAYRDAGAGLFCDHRDLLASPCSSRSVVGVTCHTAAPGPPPSCLNPGLNAVGASDISSPSSLARPPRLPFRDRTAHSLCPRAAVLAAASTGGGPLTRECCLHLNKLSTHETLRHTTQAYRPVR